MKSIKRMLIVMLSLIAITAFGQECEFYFPQQEGSQLVYKELDKKGKKTGTTKMKLVDLESNGSNRQASIEIESYDEKDGLIHAGTLEFKCEAGVFYIDMENYLNQEQMAGFEGMEIEVDSKDLPFPSKLKPGDQLDDGSITAVISNNGFKIMTINIVITDRKVESEENVSTEAGSFDCLLISQTVNSKMGIKVTASSKEWYCPGTGMIRSEVYSKNGKLMSTSELIAIN